MYDIVTQGTKYSMRREEKSLGGKGEKKRYQICRVPYKDTRQN